VRLQPSPSFSKEGLPRHPKHADGRVSRHVLAEETQQKHLIIEMDAASSCDDNEKEER